MRSLGFHVRYLRDAGLVGPLVTLVAALAVVVHLGSETFESGSGRLGPFAWPRSMALWCALSAMALCLLRGWRLWYRGRAQADRAGSPPGAAAPLAGTYHNGKMILGLAGLVLYGLGIAYMGFAFATCALLVYWLLISDVREPGTVIVIALAGPVVLLYLFVKVAYTPLPRGSGVFDALTVELYRVLGIF